LLSRSSARQHPAAEEADSEGKQQAHQGLLLQLPTNRLPTSVAVARMRPVRLMYCNMFEASCDYRLGQDFLRHFRQRA
jgi:hypothetical protein